MHPKRIIGGHGAAAVDDEVQAGGRVDRPPAVAVEELLLEDPIGAIILIEVDASHVAAAGIFEILSNFGLDILVVDEALGVGDEYFRGKPYVNRGISGQTTPQMLVRMYPDVIELKPAAEWAGYRSKDELIEAITARAKLPVMKANM